MLEIHATVTIVATGGIGPIPTPPDDQADDDQADDDQGDEPAASPLAGSP